MKKENDIQKLLNIDININNKKIECRVNSEIKYCNDVKEYIEKTKYLADILEIKKDKEYNKIINLFWKLYKTDNNNYTNLMINIINYHNYLTDNKENALENIDNNTLTSPSAECALNIIGSGFTP